MSLIFISIQCQIRWVLTPYRRIKGQRVSGHIAEILEAVLYNLHPGAVGKLEPWWEKEMWLGKANVSDEDMIATVAHGRVFARSIMPRPPWEPKKSIIAPAPTKRAKHIMCGILDKFGRTPHCPAFEEKGQNHTLERRSRIAAHSAQLENWGNQQQPQQQNFVQSHRYSCASDSHKTSGHREFSGGAAREKPPRDATSEMARGAPPSSSSSATRDELIAASNLISRIRNSLLIWLSSSVSNLISRLQRTHGLLTTFLKISTNS